MHNELTKSVNNFTKNGTPNITKNGTILQRMFHHALTNAETHLTGANERLNTFHAQRGLGRTSNVEITTTNEEREGTTRSKTTNLHQANPGRP